MNQLRIIPIKWRLFNKKHRHYSQQFNTLIVYYPPEWDYPIYPLPYPHPYHHPYPHRPRIPFYHIHK